MNLANLDIKNNVTCRCMKIFGAIANAPVMTEQEADKFLESKLNLQLATIDAMDDPNIHPHGSTITKAKEYF
ncbi:MAG TPA: hypothetical protein VE089_04820 [Nitrososphaeraceae archaeon]|nr:hypothetical protein [Nitrososphaeraceae archaeon]